MVEAGEIHSHFFRLLLMRVTFKPGCFGEPMPIFVLWKNIENSYFTSFKSNGSGRRSTDSCPFYIKEEKNNPNYALLDF